MCEIVDEIIEKYASSVIWHFREFTSGELEKGSCNRALSHDSVITCRLQKFLNLMERRTEKFDLTGGILTAFPWLRYIAPEMSGYNFLVKLNNELKNFLMVRNFDMLIQFFNFLINMTYFESVGYYQ